MSTSETYLNKTCDYRKTLKCACLTISIKDIEGLVLSVCDGHPLGSRVGTQRQEFTPVLSARRRQCCHVLVVTCAHFINSDLMIVARCPLAVAEHIPGQGGDKFTKLASVLLDELHLGGVEHRGVMAVITHHRLERRHDIHSTSFRQTVS